MPISFYDPYAADRSQQNDLRNMFLALLTQGMYKGSGNNIQQESTGASSGSSQSGPNPYANNQWMNWQPPNNMWDTGDFAQQWGSQQGSPLQFTGQTQNSGGFGGIK